MNTEQLSHLIADMTGARINDNLRSVAVSLHKRGEAAGLNLPHRLAHFTSQTAHESALFRYDRELWNGKGAQARYDTRADLGNTPERDGDGFKYRGRTGIQITGKGNTRAFRDWCRLLGLNPPDFVVTPDAMNTDPWEGLGPIWYWDTRNLNRFADDGNNEMVTRRINGGLNGYDDRLRLYHRGALILLGYQPQDIRRFQEDEAIAADGIAGPQTRRKMHEALLDEPPLRFNNNWQCAA